MSICNQRKKKKFTLKEHLNYISSNFAHKQKTIKTKGTHNLRHGYDRVNSTIAH